VYQATIVRLMKGRKVAIIHWMERVKLTSCRR
jgi:hypothetical protein